MHSRGTCVSAHVRSRTRMDIHTRIHMARVMNIHTWFHTVRVRVHACACQLMWVWLDLDDSNDSSDEMESIEMSTI